MQPTILYNPNNGITMSYDATLAGMAPNLVALTEEEYARIVGSRNKPRTAPPPQPVAEATIETVPDAELLDFCRQRGLDFGDLFEQASTEDERTQALRAIRKRAAKDLARIASAKRKA